MKIAVIFYHSNIHLIYPQRWVDKCVQSIANQTMQGFDVIELNYGDVVPGETEPRFYAKMEGKNHYPIHQKMENHIVAMNHLLDHCFNQAGYDIVFNTNMDDTFHKERFAKQIEMLLQGYDIVSSDFCYIEEREIEKEAPGYSTQPSATNESGQAPPTFTWPEQYHDPEYYDQVTVHMNICRHGNIEANLAKNHNVIAHPAVAYNKTFWTDGIKYPNVLGKEDLLLWQQAVKMGKKMYIIDEELLFYRIHAKQVGREHKA